MKKILIIYASAGDGHKSAAEAVYNAFLDLKRDDIKVTILDSLNYTNRFFKYLYKTGYIFMVKYIPTLWGFFYYLLDNRVSYAIIRPLRRFSNGLNVKRLILFLINEKFDIAISTHFLGTEVIGYLNSTGILNLPLINIITDFKPHIFWESKSADYYVVASEMTEALLMKRRVSKDRIKTLGIPIDKRFGVFFAKVEARKRLKVYPDKLTILIMGGGFGVGPIEEAVLNLQDLNIDCQIIVVCGHNKRLFKKLNMSREYFKKPTAVFGFCRNMDEIMAASDIMVTKVGGITLSEALVKALPVIAVNPIPGQEMRNAEFLFENNIGIEVKKADDLAAAIRGLLNDPERMSQIREGMEYFAKPHASEDIVKLTLGIDGQNRLG